MEYGKKSIENLSNKDIKSLKHIINECEEILLKFIYIIVKNKEKANKIIDETFNELYNNINTYDTDMELKNLIFYVARKKSINYMIYNKKYNKINLNELKKIEKNSNISEKFLRKKIKYDCKKLINNLTEKDREIVFLKDFGELEFKDIGCILNINEKSVERRYYNVKEEFYNFLKNKQYDKIIYNEEEVKKLWIECFELKDMELKIQQNETEKSKVNNKSKQISKWNRDKILIIMFFIIFCILILTKIFK